MRVGTVVSYAGLAGGPSGLRDLAIEIESLGFDHILAYDHVLGADRESHPNLNGPYGIDDPFHDPLVMLAYVSAVTTSIELATGILVLPQRQTALVARQAADIDLLSGARLRLGVGVGWNSVEFEALDVEFATRASRLEEQIGLLRLLWSSSVVDFNGTFHRVTRAGLNPRPRKQIPIWIGGSGQRAFARAAHLAEGFIFTARDEPAHQVAAMRAELKRLGRTDSSFGMELLVTGRTPQRVVGRIEQWAELGGTHASVVTLHNGFRTIDQHLDQLRVVSSLLNLDARR